jgi:hypothetical protein
MVSLNIGNIRAATASVAASLGELERMNVPGTRFARLVSRPDAGHVSRS